MLEFKSYTKAELSSIFKTKDMQGLKRKMDRYEISYEIHGQGESAIITITDIGKPFAVYCTTELEFDGRTDFYKLRNYYYYFFNDIEFRGMPNEVQEHRMLLANKYVSRQSIAKYHAKLEKKNMILIDSGNYMYYFAFKDKQRIVEKEEYTKAWQEYWNDIKNGLPNYIAILNMRNNYGGVARKQEIPEINAIHNKDIDYLCTIIQKDIERELESV